MLDSEGSRTTYVIKVTEGIRSALNVRVMLVLEPEEPLEVGRKGS